MATSGDIGPCIGSSESSNVHRDKKVVIPERDEILLDPLANWKRTKATRAINLGRKIRVDLDFWIRTGRWLRTPK